MIRRGKDLDVGVAAEKRYPREVARKKNRIRAVVPRIVFSTIFVGVVPACVASACGGTAASSVPYSDGGRDALFPPGNVANQCFAGSTNPSCPQMGVAAVAFQCFDGSTQPGCPRPPIGDAATDGSDGSDDADGAG